MQDGLNKLMSLLGPEGIQHLVAQGPEAIGARLEAVPSYENAQLEYLQQEMSASFSSMTPPSVTDDFPRPMPPMMSVKVFEGKDGEDLLLWVKEVETAIASAMLQTEQQRVVLAIFKLGGRAREWALMCGTSVGAKFPSSAELKLQLSLVFSPPN
ncbi:uncharacterized protein PHALS_09900 [Plasmopara halstedii]|uniref:Retrotransposon gag domain-containing protein n=1 Tax=Plasmopara halstedii TaxID=4781 RepID=A0A0P1AFY9_PLAHL|nr:uncharacterized protein PHALS_09900 [Plasmopara halstedii]CEG39663.1 hypothetical protein PHALS_09900 [Plasmopara halstedii]|eukprot:XP_024576032.1 hypothetical protein PHALS_09900 [Plasmopara halstedii]